MRILIYNKYFSTFGGGERSTLSIAKALAQIYKDSEIILASTSLNPINLNTLLNFFGFLQENWTIKQFKNEEELSNYVRLKKIDLFVNHTYGSYLPNPAPKGIYVVMFPWRSSIRQVKEIRTYSYVISISEFTRFHVEKYWHIPSKVLVPPIIVPKQNCTENKEKIILNIGRFSVHGHNKNQLITIQTFKELLNEGLDKTWKLVVAGHLNSGRDNKLYFNQCKALVKNTSNIELISKIDHATLSSYYKRASLLWQLTGCHLKGEERPEHCEHLGLVALDCFAYGVVPVVFYRSGVSSLIGNYTNGYNFNSLEELKKATLSFSDDKILKERLMHGSLNSYNKYSLDSYVENLKDILIGDE